MLPMKSLCTVVLLSILSAVAPVRAGETVTETVQCSFGDAPAVACTLHDRVDRDGMHHMQFVAGDHATTFTGRMQSGWWSGWLNGKKAMGYELNRGHVVYSTAAMDARFEWWSTGKQHGTY